MTSTNPGWVGPGFVLLSVQQEASRFPEPGDLIDKLARIEATVELVVLPDDLNVDARFVDID
jgi:hypothetical protein